LEDLNAKPDRLLVLEDRRLAELVSSTEIAWEQIESSDEFRYGPAGRGVTVFPTQCTGPLNAHHFPYKIAIFGHRQRNHLEVHQYQIRYMHIFDPENFVYGISFY
jgi:hypothetical protein